MTIERRIAGRAKELVSGQVQKDAKHEAESKYRALCESFPILLRSAGLAQTVAFLRAKGPGEGSRANEYSALYGDLEKQFRDIGFLGEEALSERAAGAKLSQADYRLYSEIAMKAALWHKRLAQALLRKKGD
ncbi:MAG: type III-B CRISPR module-associated protein Cmr5 [Bryobacteraceae bacterium]